MASLDPVDKPQIIEHVNKSIPWTVFDTKWVPSSARFVALGNYARGTGAMQVYQLNQGKLKMVHEHEKKNAFKCGTFGAASLEERHIATGDFEGHMMVWDLEKGDYPVYSVKGHKTIINCIDGVGGTSTFPGAPEIVTGSRDGIYLHFHFHFHPYRLWSIATDRTVFAIEIGCVRVWDVRQKDDPVASLEPAEGQAMRDCWAVAFGDSYDESHRVVCAGFDNGDLKMFDLRTMTLRWETNVKNGICGIEFDRKNVEMNKLLVTTLEGRFRVYDLRTFHPEKGYATVIEKAHESTIWTGRHLPQCRDIFMTCAGSGSLMLWKYSYPDQRMVKDSEGLPCGVAGKVEKLCDTNLSTQPIASFDWNASMEGLCVFGAFDQCIRVGFVTNLSKAY
jgi:WD repeat-containing protein 92